MLSESPTTAIAIAGVTGKLGRLIAKHLLSDDADVHVHGITRNPENIPERLKSHPRFHVFVCTMEDESTFRAAVRNCSILICTILASPSVEVSLQKAMIDACLAEGVPRFMANDFTLEWQNIDLDMLQPKRVNQEIMEYLEEHDDRIQGVHVLSGAFMETMFTEGYWCLAGKSPAEGLYYWGTGDEIWELTSYDNAARYAAAVALDNRATGILRFLGDRLTIKEIAQTIEDVYDVPPIPLTCKGDFDDLRSEIKRGLLKDPEGKEFWSWKGQSYTLFLTNGDGWLMAPLHNGVYAETVEQETLEIWMQDRSLEELTSIM